MRGMSRIETHEKSFGSRIDMNYSIVMAGEFLTVFGEIKKKFLARIQPVVGRKLYGECVRMNGK